MSRRIAVIADDMTGANDSVVQFAEAGWDAYMVYGSGFQPPEGAADLALAVSTDSRALTAPEATDRVQAAVARALAGGADRVYLKIDSTMRGSIPAAIEGTLRELRRRSPHAKAVVCSAYPRMGRTVAGGRLLVNGTPVDQTAIGTDPVSPVTTAELTALIPGAWPVAAISDELLSDPDAPAVLAPDAETDADLQLIAEAVDRAGEAAFGAGSAGLAAPLARLWRTSGASSSDQVSAGGGRILILVTSLNPASREQVATFCGLRPEVAVLSPTKAQLAGAKLDELAAAWVPRLGHVTVLASPTDRAAGDDASPAPREIAVGMARLAATLAHRGAVDALVLFGGDGAQAVIEATGTQAIRITSQVLPGIPRGVLVGGTLDGTVVVTKAGGFGGPDTISAIVEDITDGGSA